MTPLVLVHGFMGGSAQWTQQAPLHDRRNVIAVDLPGFGQNTDLEPVGGIEEMADWVLDKLDAQSISRFDLLGHSMGGMIVQEIVRKAPPRVRNLVLYGTGARGVLPGRFESIETSIERANVDGPEATARRIAATWFLDGDRAEGYGPCARIAAKCQLGSIVSGLKAMRDWSGEDHLPAILARTLILWGDCDRTYAWPEIEKLWQTIPDSHLAVLPACAHAVHMERSALFNAIVDEFLEG